MRRGQAEARDRGGASLAAPDCASSRPPEGPLAAPHRLPARAALGAALLVTACIGPFARPEPSPPPPPAGELPRGGLPRRAPVEPPVDRPPVAVALPPE